MFPYSLRQRAECAGQSLHTPRQSCANDAWGTWLVDAKAYTVSFLLGSLCSRNLRMQLKVIKSRALPIGIDLGSAAVKVVQLRRSDDQIELTASAMLEVPP